MTTRVNKIKEVSLTHERLTTLLNYDPIRGEFKWKVRRPNALVGAVAGSTNKAGYIKLVIDNVQFLGHRVAWFYITGRWPVDKIDHINFIRNDNSWSNLREATHSQNLSHSKNWKRRSLPKGVIKNGNRYGARIYAHGHKYIWLGNFVSIEEAEQAYIKASLKWHGEFSPYHIIGPPS